jgi:peptide/nickel transport system permease protein
MSFESLSGNMLPGNPADGGSFTPIAIFEDDQVSNLKYLSQLELYWRRFRKNRLALIGAAMLLLLVLMAILAPVLVPGGVKPDTPFLDLPFGENGPTLANFPSRLFGNADAISLNYSVYAMVIYGARLSLIIGVAAALTASFIGTVLGSISGYFGSWVDNVIMRVTDVFLTLPFLPLVIAISSIYSGGSGNVILIIGILAFTGWAGLCRLVRAQFLTLREMEYAQAATAVGVNRWRIIFRHLLPNTFAPIIVATTLNVAVFIVLESTLDFLRLGVQFPPTATWGNVLANAQSSITNGNWWWTFFPGAFIVVTVLAINFVGDGLRDALDVRDRVG